MDYKKPEKASIKAWRLRRIITLVIILAVFAVVLIMAIFAGGVVLTVICAVIGLAVLYQVISMIVFPLIEYKQWKYLITDDRVEIIHGIFFVKRDVIPVVRIQNITVKQGPIYRKYGLHSVEIALASGTFQIVGLGLETAEDIADKMRKRLYKEGILAHTDNSSKDDSSETGAI